MWAKMNKRRVSNNLVGSKKSIQCFSLCYGLNDTDPIIVKFGKDLEELNDLAFPREVFKTIGIASVLFSFQI